MAESPQVTVEVESARLLGTVRRYAQAMDRGVVEVMEEQMGRTLWAAAAFTPPFPRGAKGVQVWQRTGRSGRRTIRWADHREAGRNAVLADLLGRAGRQEGLFVIRPREWFEAVFDAVEMLGPGGGVEVEDADRARLIGTIRKSLPLGWEESAVRAEYKEHLRPDATVEEMGRHHERYRSRRTGRTSRRSRRASIIGRSAANDVMVVTNEALQRYLKTVQARVFTLKGGWVIAEERLGLGVKWPAMLRKVRPRGGGTGTKQLKGDRKYILASNLVRYAGAQEGRARIAARAMRFAAENMESQIEALSRREWRRRI